MIFDLRFVGYVCASLALRIAAGSPQPDLRRCEDL